MKKRIYRSRENVMVGGVLAGLAEYFDQDSTLWRLAFVVLLIATGLMPGLLIYIVAWILMPQAPEQPFTDVTDVTEEPTTRDAETE